MLKDPLVKIILLLVLAGCGVIFWATIERGRRKGAEYDRERARAAQAIAEADVAVSAANTAVLAGHIDRVDASTSSYASDMATISMAADAASVAVSQVPVDPGGPGYDQRRAACSVCYDAWAAICGPYMPTATTEHPAD